MVERIFEFDIMDRDGALYFDAEEHFIRVMLGKDHAKLVAEKLMCALPYSEREQFLKKLSATCRALNEHGVR